MRNQIYGWLLVGPFVMTLGVFFIYAFIRTIIFSFTQYDLFNDAIWTGFNNYISLFHDDLFLLALSNTIWFSLVVTFIQTILALVLSILVNSKVRGQGFFRTAFYVPGILSSASITLIFIWLYQKNGYLNSFVTSIVNHYPQLSCFAVVSAGCQLLLVINDKRRGLPTGWCDPAWGIVSLIVAGMTTVALSATGWLVVGEEIVQLNWLSTRDSAGPLPVTLWAIVIQNIYTTVPTFMLLFLAGLQGIPGELYEAARIDGANKWQQHWHITIPQLAPVIFVVVTFSIIGTLQMFDQVALLGAAAPLESRITLAYYVYHNAFPPGGKPQVGMASAAALILAMITLMIVYLQKFIGIKEKMHG